MGTKILSSKPTSRLSRSSSVQARLQQEPYRFDFFQAVRLLKWIAKRAGRSSHRVSAEDAPQDEIVRFKSLAAHAFPQGAISGLKGIDDTTSKMEVAFLGMFGPNGVLPRHYTQMIIDRSRAKDDTLRDFLDLFNHRFISHFYCAWAKNRLPIAYEEGQLTSAHEDDFGRAFYSLVGWGHESMRHRMEVDDTAFVYYGGQFAAAQRNATSLQMIVADYFEIEAEVIQLVGKWLYLSPADQSTLSSNRRLPSNNCLGTDVVVGERVWSVENNFRIRIGPMKYEQFVDLTPAGSGLTSLSQVVRSYVGLGFEFDVQLVLQKDEVPACRLATSTEEPTARLGWNTWVHNKPFGDHVDDAVFANDGSPTRP